jgi:hypothetical protein
MQLVRARLECLRKIAGERWDVVSAVSDTALGSGDYDDYLLEAAKRLQEGAHDDEIADYFINVATEELGVDTGSGIRARALILAKAIRDQVEMPPQIGGCWPQR